jgi:hypothetical protein
VFDDTPLWREIRLTFLLERSTDSSRLLEDQVALVGDGLGRADALDERAEVVGGHGEEREGSVGGGKGQRMVGVVRACCIHLALLLWGCEAREAGKWRERSDEGREAKVELNEELLKGWDDGW